MARITTLALRMAWSQHRLDVSLALAASIFVAAGTVILYIVNFVFTYRIIRAQHPRLAESRPFSIFFRFLLISVALTIAILITAVVQASYTLDQNIHRIDRNLQLYGSTYMAIVAFMPIPLIFISLVTGHR